MKEQPMSDENPMGQVIQIDEARIRDHLGEMVRGTVEETLNAMLDAEADQLCGAGRYERSQARQDTRAGSYDRTLQTSAGEVSLKVPKLRRQTFETAIIERYRRRESSVEEALIEMYLAGISVRRVEDITEALWGTRVSPSTVSNLNKKIYAKIEAWRNRRIEGEHPYLYLDGIIMKRTWAGEVRNVSLLVASAVNSEGFREILGICEGAKEDKSGWSAFLRHLVDRGLNGVQLIISDACRGLMESAAEYRPQARWQRCMVHFYRNVFSHVPATRVREVSHTLKAIHAQENREAADRKARAIVEDLRAAKMNTAADLVERSVSETLTYYAFPDIHWQKIRTTDEMDKRFYVRRGIFSWAGDTTPTDSRSQRNRASRRGGQLTTRARSSSYRSACPHLRAPGASVPDGRTIRCSQTKLQRDVGPALLIPVNNPLERIMKEIRRRTVLLAHSPTASHV
jgi:putative transposase